MKKLCLSILAMILLFPSAMFAVEDDVKIGNLWYNLIDKAKVAEVTDCDRNAVNVVVPSTVNYNGKTYKVERIREKAFSPNQRHIDNGGGKKIKSLQLPEGIIEICERAFDGSDIESVNIPKSVTTIGESAFSGCSKLSSMIVLTNIDKVENYTFYGCSSLTSVTLSDKVTYISHSAFAYCKKLESITIPNSVTTIDIDAFSNCSSLKSINIPKSVINIYMDSFGNAFANCESVTSIVVAHDNPIYDSRDNCNAIIDKRLNRLVTGCQNTTIPKGIWEIVENAFQGCKKLKAIDIPSSVYSIGYGAFQNCEELTSVTFHGDLSSFGWSVFKGCKSLKSIELPNGVEELSCTFEDCSVLETIKLPNTVNKLSNSFKNCSNMTEFNIPERVSSIGDFDNCKKIKSVSLPYGISKIMGFNECDNLETIHLPSSANSISDSFSQCKSLFDVYCYAVKPPFIYQNDKSFSGSDIKYSTLHVPEQSIEEYSKATLWKDFGKIVGFKIQEMSKDEVLSKLDELYNLCQKDLDDIDKALGDNEYKFTYSNLTTLPSDLRNFQQDIDGFRKDIKNNSYQYDYKPDYYRYAHLEKLWNETYHPLTTTIISKINDILNNLVTLNYKCSSGGKIKISNTSAWTALELSNGTKQVQFVSPEYVRRNGCEYVYIYAYPDEGYHVQSIKVGGVEQIGISEYNEEKLYNGVRRYNSIRFSYNDVEVVFASGESGIQSIRVDGKSNNVYSINGIKVRENTTSLEGLPKGIYIVDGKKVVVK